MSAPTAPPNLRARLEATVLVIEDDPDIRRMIRAALEAAGAKGEDAADAEEALAKITEGSFDAAVLDWNLGATNSARLLEEMQSSWPELFEHTLIMSGDFLSAGDNNAEARLGRPLLAKPFRPRNLIERLAELLG